MSITSSAPSRMALSMLVGWRLALMIRMPPSGARLAQLPDQVRAVAVRQAEIQDHHVEARRRRGLGASLGHGARLGDHL